MGISEAMAEGAVMLPNLMLVGLFQGHYGEKAYGKLAEFSLVWDCLDMGPSFEPAGMNRRPQKTGTVSYPSHWDMEFCCF